MPPARVLFAPLSASSSARRFIVDKLNFTPNNKRDGDKTSSGINLIYENAGQISVDINTARLDTIEGSKSYLAILSQIAFIKTCIWTILAQVFPFVFNISIFINSTSGEIIKSIN